MSNFIFLSLDNDSSIEHAKISVKFDNFNKGKARVSIRTIFKTSGNNSKVGFYLLIKNDENPVILEDIISEYNEYLDTGQFRQVAGAYGLQQQQDVTYCTIYTIETFPENPLLEDRIAIHPKKITCERVYYDNAPEKLKKEISGKDILLRIEVDNVKRVLDEAFIYLKNEYVWIFQFRILLQKYIPEETLKCWEFSNQSWSVDFDVHKYRNYENVIRKLDDMNILRYPKSLELWFTIPYLHQFIASSPVYEKAFRLKPEDVWYKTEKKEKKTESQQAEEFETREGDYAVKIVNKSGKFAEFSIICASPFLPGEEPKELKKKIDEFRANAPKYVMWKEMINPLVLLLALMTLASAIVNVFLMGMARDLELRLTLWTIIVAAIFFGLSVWGVVISLYVLFQRIIKPKTALLIKSDLMIEFLTISIIFVIMVSILIFYFLMTKNVFSAS